jgi:hypothetical protein
LPPEEITILIKQCDSYLQLQDVVRQQGPSFNYIHAAAALTHAAQLAQDVLQHQQQQQHRRYSSSSADPQQPQQQLMQQQAASTAQQQQQQVWPAGLLATLPLLLQHAQQQCPSFQGRQVANCLWAAQRLLHAVQQQRVQLLEASSQADPQQQQQQQQQQQAQVQELQLLQQLQAQLLELIQQLQQQAESCWHLFNGQELVLLLYTTSNTVGASTASAAADSASHITADVVADAPTVDGLQSERYISSTRSSSSNSTEAGAGTVATDEAHAATAAGSAAVDYSWLSRALQQLQRLHRKRRLRLKPQEFEMLLISLRRLLPQQQQQQQEGELQWPEQYQQQQDMRSQSSSSSSGFELPVQLLQQQLALVLQQPERCSCRDVAGIVYSYAVLGLSSSSSSGLLGGSSSSSLRGLASSMTYKALRSICNPADITNLLYGLAMLQQQEQSMQQGPSSSSSGSVVRLAGQSQEWWVALFKGIGRQLRQFTAGELVACLYALAKLRVRPPQRLLAAAVAVAAAQLQPSQQQELVLLLWSVGALRFKLRAQLLTGVIGKYLQGAAASTVLRPSAVSSNGIAARENQEQQQQLSAQHVSMVLWASGRLGYCPPAQQLQQLLQQSQQLLPFTSPQQLACIAYGLGSIGVRPVVTWLGSLYERLLELLAGVSGFRQAGSEGLAAGASATSEPRMTGQGLAMVSWGLARMQAPLQTADEGGAAAAAAAAAGQGGASLADVLSASEQLLVASPEVAGVVLWGFVRLRYKPEPQLVYSVLQSFLQGRQQQRQQGQQQQQQQRTRRQQQQQGPRLAHSLSLTAWVLSQLGAGDDEQQLLLQVLRSNTQLVRG